MIIILLRSFPEVFLRIQLKQVNESKHLVKQFWENSTEYFLPNSVNLVIHLFEQLLINMLHKTTID